MTLLDKLTSANKVGLFIGGDWLPASDGRVIEVYNPATEEVLAEVASASPEDGLAAVGAAAAAADSWAALAPRVRGETLRRAFELLIKRSDEFAELITTENGKTISDSRGEVGFAAEFFRWFSEEAVRNHGDLYMAPSGDKRVMVVNQPVGISILVTPWNFPLSMATRKIGPALAAGCTVVLKPASDTPLVSLALADLLEDAGVPAGVVNVIPADRSSAVVKAVLADTRVRKLSFTGSTEVGRTLLKEAANQVLRTSMELGGNAPFLVFADADIDAAVEGALLAKMRNAGEACTAANRFYVEAPVVAVFSEKLSAAMSQLKVGSGMDPTVDIGPLINRRSHRKVAELVETAAAGSARILTGGGSPDGPGFFYLPTVLADIEANAAILGEEIFGPVAPVVTFEGLDQAITMANDTEHGLISYVYTGDTGRGFEIAEALEAGMVAVNRGLISDAAAPFGGVKQSGVGREGAHHGLMEYLEPKYIGI